MFYDDRFAPCPKCSQGELRGPRYECDHQGNRGKLRYVCSVCGYEMHTPCVDAKKQTEIPWPMSS